MGAVVLIVGKDETARPDLGGRDHFRSSGRIVPARILTPLPIEWFSAKFGLKSIAFREQTMSNFQRWSVCTTLVAILATSRALYAAERPFGLTKRIPLTTSRVVGYPDPLPPFRAKRIYPHLTFKQPLHVAKEPTTDRLFVTERYGKIFAIRHDRNTRKRQLLLDLKRDTYSLCFHPDYAKNGYIYVFSNGTFGGKHQNRIARYTVARSGIRKNSAGKRDAGGILANSATSIDPKTETVIIQWPSNGHNGHFLRFGPDGMLWISAGDGTVGMDPKLDGQNIANLRGTMIRIDVDHPAKGKVYSVPKDNPFVGRKGARSEIWAFGFRNPYRFTFDPMNGELWVADIGQDVWEMLYHVTRGGNYGWSVMEGPEPLNLTRPRGPGPFIPPVIAHPHSEMRSITGGFFYRGTKFPELRGAFLYGDYDTRRVWAMRYDYRRKKVTYKKEIARTIYRIISVDEDRDREIILTSFGGELLTLERTPKSAAPKYPFPRKLSESGLFASVKDHRMAPGVVPYDVNSPLWSDGAFKQRFIAVPGTEKVGFAASRAWDFPQGTVLVKTFSIDTEQGNPKSRKQIETRFLTLHDNGEWAGYTYRWNDEQTDAFLVDKAGENATFEVKNGKRARTKRWRFPSRAECMVCHTREARYVLGLTTLQMNRERDYAGVRDNQIRSLAHIGFFKGKVGSPASLPRLPDPADESQPLEARARSYLHANCWHCHVENGGGNAQMELSFLKKPAETKIYDVKPRHITFGLKDARLIAPGDPGRSVILRRIAIRGKHQMPPVSSFERDNAGLKLLTDWVRSMQPATKAIRRAKPTVQKR
jgi:uncharacterized repeat protein (TIGR03806 family)